MEIVIRQGYRSFSIQVPQLGRLDDLKMIIAAHEEVVPTQIQVVFKRKILMNNQVLKDIGITEGTVVDAIVSRNTFEIPFTHPEEVGLVKLPLMKENEGPSTTMRDVFMAQEKIRMLMNMGFQLEQVRIALQLANGDVITAASYLPLDDDKIILIKTTRPKTRLISESSPIHDIKEAKEEKITVPTKIEVLPKLSLNKVKESPVKNEAPLKAKEEEVIAKVKEFLSNKKRCNLIANLVAGVNKNTGKRIRNNPDYIIELVKGRQEEKKLLKGLSPTQRDSVKKLAEMGLPFSFAINLLNQYQWNLELAMQYIRTTAERAANELGPSLALQMLRPSMDPRVPLPVTVRTSHVPLNNPVNEEPALVSHMDSAPDAAEISSEQEETAHIGLRPRGGFRRRE